jgi:hypothetical protein
VKDLEAMLNEDHPIRRLLSNEEDEPHSNDSTSAPSISVDINADIGEREEVRSLETSAIGGEFDEIYFLVARFFDSIDDVLRSKSMPSTNRFRSLAYRSYLRPIRDPNGIDVQVVSVSHHNCTRILLSIPSSASDSERTPSELPLLNMYRFFQVILRSIFWPGIVEKIIRNIMISW